MQMLCCCQKLVLVIEEEKTGQVLTSPAQTYINCQVIGGAGIAQV